MGYREVYKELMKDLVIIRYLHPLLTDNKRYFDQSTLSIMKTSTTFILLSLAAVASARNMQVINNCPFTIWYALSYGVIIL